MLWQQGCSLDRTPTTSKHGTGGRSVTVGNGHKKQTVEDRSYKSGWTWWYGTCASQTWTWLASHQETEPKYWITSHIQQPPTSSGTSYGSDTAGSDLHRKLKTMLQQGRKESLMLLLPEGSSLHMNSTCNIRQRQEHTHDQEENAMCNGKDKEHSHTPQIQLSSSSSLVAASTSRKGNHEGSLPWSTHEEDRRRERNSCNKEHW